MEISRQEVGTEVCNFCSSATGIVSKDQAALFNVSMREDFITDAPVRIRTHCKSERLQDRYPDLFERPPIHGGIWQDFFLRLLNKHQSTL